MPAAGSGGYTPTSAIACPGRIAMITSGAIGAISLLFAGWDKKHCPKDQARNYPQPLSVVHTAELALLAVENGSSPDDELHDS